MCVCNIKTVKSKSEKRQIKLRHLKRKKQRDESNKSCSRLSTTVDRHISFLWMKIHNNNKWIIYRVWRSVATALTVAHKANTHANTQITERDNKYADTKNYLASNSQKMALDLYDCVCVHDEYVFYSRFLRYYVNGNTGRMRNAASLYIRCRHLRAQMWD